MSSPHSRMSISPYQTGVFNSNQNYFKGTPSPHQIKTLNNKENYYMSEATEKIDRPFMKILNTAQNSQHNLPLQSCDNLQRLTANTARLAGEQDDCNRLSLEQINKELDQNINELVYLMNRRRMLVTCKRTKLCEEFNKKLDDIGRTPLETLLNDLKQVDDEAIRKLLGDSEHVSRITGLIGDTGSQGSKRRVEEISKSQEFWSLNKNIEIEIDQLLQHLKYLDREVASYAHMNQIMAKMEDIKDECHKLDDLDDRIRDLLIHKSQDSLTRAEPIFQAKQKLTDQLNHKLKSQNQMKQEKIGKIAKIIAQLQQLKGIREARYKSIKALLGDGDQDVFPEKFSLVIQKIEALGALQDRLVTMEDKESTISSDLDKSAADNELVFSDVVKRASEEARIFSEWTEGLRRRLRYHKVLNFYSQIISNRKCQQLDMKQMSTHIKEELTYLQPLTDETVAIRGGIVKTEETSRTFQDILNSLSNENQRRKEILAILEQCSHWRQQEEQKTEQLRVIELELVKKHQQKKHLQEDLEGVLGDADLSTFKRIENMMNNFESEVGSLQQKKSSIQNELSQINLDVFQEIDVILHEYRDILNDILPVNWVTTYDLKKTQHLKIIKTQLKKTLKRIGNID